MTPLLLFTILITLLGAWPLVFGVGGLILVLLVICAVPVVVLALVAELWERLTESKRDKAIRRAMEGYGSARIRQ